MATEGIGEMSIFIERLAIKEEGEEIAKDGPKRHLRDWQKTLIH